MIWPQEVTLIRWTQPSGPLCLWQCFSKCPLPAAMRFTALSYLYLQKLYIDFSLSSVIFATANFDYRKFFLDTLYTQYKSKQVGWMGTAKTLYRTCFSRLWLTIDIIVVWFPSKEISDGWKNINVPPSATRLSHCLQWILRTTTQTLELCSFFEKRM